MNMSASVRTEIDGPVSTIVMNRPKQRNAVDRPMADALRAAFEHFEADESQRVAVLWGEHGVVDKCFDVLALWRERAQQVTGASLPCGHYIAR